MLIDFLNQFSAAYSPTAVGTTYSDVLDLGVDRDVGGAVTENLMMLIQVTTAFTSAGSATMRVQYQTSSDNVTYSTLVQSDDVPVASMIAGYRFLENSAPDITKRYNRIAYIIGTAAMTAGVIKSAFTPDLQRAPSYAAGYTA